MLLFDGDGQYLPFIETQTNQNRIIMEKHTEILSHGREKQTKNQQMIATVWLATLILGLIAVCNNTLYAQSSSSQSTPQETTLFGTLHLYLVTNYGEKMQEVNHYRKTGEGSMVAFILKHHFWELVHLLP